MNDYLAENCVFDACKHLEKAIEQLEEASLLCEFSDDKDRLAEAIKELNLIYEKLV